MKANQVQLFLLTIMVPLSVFTTDLYLASFQELTIEFSASHFELQLSLSVYLGGFALFTLLSALLSQKLGCKKVLIAGLCFYILGTLIALTTQSISLFILGRFMQSFGGSTSSVITRTIVRDRFSVETIRSALSWMFFSVSVALILAPIVGSILQHFYGWRANFILMACLGFVYLLNAFYVTDSPKNAIRPAIILSLCRQSTYNLYTVFTILAWGGLMSFVSLFPFLILFYFKKSSLSFGAFYALMMLFFIAGNRYPQKTLFRGVLTILIGSSLLCCSSWSKSLLFFLSSSAIFLFGTGFVLPQIQMRAISSIHTGTSYAFALMYFGMMLLGAFSGIIISHCHDYPFFGAIWMAFLGFSQTALYFFLKTRKQSLNIT